MTKNITDPRTLLFDSIDGVKNGALDLDKAKIINELSKTLVDTARAEIDHAKITGGMAGDFMETGAAARLSGPGESTRERTCSGTKTTTTLANGATIIQHPACEADPMAIPTLFRGPCYDTSMGKLQAFTMSSEERVAIVRKCDSLSALRDALACGDLQRTVADAIRRRIRRLESS